MLQHLLASEEENHNTEIPSVFWFAVKSEKTVGFSFPQMLEELSSSPIHAAGMEGAASWQGLVLIHQPPAYFLKTDRSLLPLQTSCET